MKVLFILKRRPDYNGEIHSHIGVSTGLFNSATFTSNMLADAGIDESKIESEIMLAKELGFISDDELNDMSEKLDHTSKMISSLLKKIV